MYRALIILISTPVMAHQFTPTYPLFEPSFVEGVYVVKMELFNSRKDVGHYELSVHTGNWKPVPFASEDRVIPIRYLETKKISIYLRQGDVAKAEYVCTTSKLPLAVANQASIASRICSKVR